MAKSTAPKKNDAEQVADYMAALQHPLKAEIDAVRNIIIHAGAELSERVKWNAPSYHYQGTDLLTFNPRLLKSVHLIFHHIIITGVSSPLLEGNYKDRRMVYLTDMADIKNKQPELERILQACVQGLKSQ